MKKSSIFAVWAAAVLSALGVKPDNPDSQLSISNPKNASPDNLGGNTPAPILPGFQVNATSPLPYSQEQIRIELENAYDTYNKTVEEVNEELEKTLKNNNLTSEEMAFAIKEAERNLQTAAINVVEECKDILVHLVVDTSGTTASGGKDDIFYRQNKDLALLLLEMLPDSVKVAYTQFSVYRRSLDYTISHADLANGMRAMVYQGGGTHVNLPIEYANKLYETGVVAVPTAEHPHVLVIFTDGNGQQLEKTKAAIESNRELGGEHSHIMLVLTEGESGIDDVTLPSMMIPGKDWVFTFREPNAIKKATEGLEGALKEACRQPSKSPSSFPPTSAENPIGGTFIPTTSPTCSPTSDGDEWFPCQGWEILFCIPLFPRFEVDKEEEEEPAQPSTDIEAHGIPETTPHTISEGTSEITREGAVISNMRPEHKGYKGAPGGATSSTQGIFMPRHIPANINETSGFEYATREIPKKVSSDSQTPKEAKWKAKDGMVGFTPIVLINIVSRWVKGDALIKNTELKASTLYNLTKACCVKLDELKDKLTEKQNEERNVTLPEMPPPPRI